MNTNLSEEDRFKYQNPDTIRNVLGTLKTVAVVGLSSNPQRPSNFVGSYLHAEGYKVVPVNPRETEVFGQQSYPDLKSIPFPVDVVDIFRHPSAAMELVQDAIEIKAKVIWMQLTIVNRDAAELAREAGLTVIMDKCMKMEHGRYNGNLHWVGMNTEIITAKKVSRLF
ncbi:MAG: CoA-binding protein [Bacteroidota bacterium]